MSGFRPLPPATGALSPDTPEVYCRTRPLRRTATTPGRAREPEPELLPPLSDAVRPNFAAPRRDASELREGISAASFAQGAADDDGHLVTMHERLKRQGAKRPACLENVIGFEICPAFPLGMQEPSYARCRLLINWALRGRRGPAFVSSAASMSCRAR